MNSKITKKWGKTDSGHYFFPTLYNKDKPNFFNHNSHEYWIIDSPDLEAIQNFGMSKTKKDHSKLVKDNETQSVTSEKEQSDSESEKRGRRK